MQNELNVRLIDMANRAIEYHDNVFDIIQKLESESMSRIVWFVAIAGFALINVPSLAKSNAPTVTLPPIMLAWVITALLGSLTHWEFRTKSVRNLELYILKRELLMAYVVNGADMATMTELQEIFNNKKEPLRRRLDKQVWAARFADWFEFATLISFVASMWLVISSFAYQVIP